MTMAEKSGIGMNFPARKNPMTMRIPTAKNRDRWR
jgi:hypothetical protein